MIALSDEFFRKLVRETRTTNNALQQTVAG